MYIFNFNKQLIRSITEHFDQIMFTLGLTFILIYTYSLIAFVRFKEMFDKDGIKVCQNLIGCYSYVTMIGLKEVRISFVYDKGIGDLWNPIDFNNDSRLYFYY